MTLAEDYNWGLIILFIVIFTIIGLAVVFDHPTTVTKTTTIVYKCDAPNCVPNT